MKKKFSNNWAIQTIKSKAKFWFIVFALIIGGLIILHLVYPVANVDEVERTISRNLKSARFLVEQPNELPEMAWREELPGFMKRDLQKVLEDDWTVKYKYFNTEITIRRSCSMYYEEEYYFYLYVNLENDKYDSINFFNMTDLSLYKKDKALYFYVWTNDNKFKQLIVNNNFLSSKVLSYNAKDVPLSVNDEKSWIVCKDYVLVQNGKKFTIWKDGNELSKATFDFGEIEEVFDTYSIIATKDCKLYGINIYKDRDKSYMPIVSFDYIGKVDDISPLRNSTDNNLIIEFPKRYVYMFPIFENNGEYYACLPVDFKAYASYSMANKGEAKWYEGDYDLSKKLVKLTESQFASADIYYGYCPYICDFSWCWVANLEFKHNGFSYYYLGYPILGYDREYYLTDIEKEKLTKKVFSIEDYWQAVADIRKAYEAYYEKP